MQGREIAHQFSVAYRHRVLFSDDCLATANPTLAEMLEPAARALVVVDRGVVERVDVVRQVGAYFQAHQDRIALAGEPIVVSGGEAAKRDMATFDQCVRALRDAKIDRHSYMIAIGGGAMLDASGFAASVVHRGVRQVRIPTTVLAQADAGIGVKNGINYLGSKNFLGCFAVPEAVINDFGLLSGLPAEQWRDGSVEAVKVALLRDAEFFGWIRDNLLQLIARAPAAMRYLIFRCAQLHVEHIATGGDPFERGSARPLDFGHWAAHKLEQLSGYALSHGHAVAVGIAIDVLYAVATGLLERGAAQQIIGSLAWLGFEMAIGAQVGLDPGCDRLLDGIEEFREHLGGQLSITSLRGVGQPVELHAIDRNVMRECAKAILFAEGDLRYSVKVP